MAPRSMFKGTINFGMVPVPVKMYKATEEKKVHFRQLHRECHTPINLVKVCPTCDLDLEAGEIVKGYEMAKGQFVELDETDLDALPVSDLESIEVVEFVDENDPEGNVIDPRSYNASYFLSPDKGGGKAFWLMLKVMEQSGLTAIARMCMREREHLVSVKPFGKVLLLQTLYWADELRDASEIEAEAVAVSDGELEMAGRLIAAMTSGTLDLGKFKDEYREAVLRLVEVKASGAVVSAPEKKAAVPVADLSAALEASLAEILEKKGVRV